MQLTTKGRYAVTAMLDLVLNSEQGPVSLADISDRQSISLAYLEQLFALLRKGGLVKSVRGPGGGYLLGRSSFEIPLYDIIDTVNESVDVTRCGGVSNCQQGKICISHHLWCELSKQIQSFLSDITLGALVQKEEIKQVAARQQSLLKAKAMQVKTVQV